MSDVPVANAPVDSAPTFESAMAAAMATINAAPEETASAPPPDAVPAAVVAAPAVDVAPVAPGPDLRVGELEAKLAAAEAALTEARKSPPPVETDWSKFAADPVGTLRRANPGLSAADAAKVAEKLYYHALGDQAPVEYRLREEMNANIDPKVAKLEKELAEIKSARESEQRAAQITDYQKDLRAYGPQLTAEKFPILESLAKRNPDRFTQVLYQVALQEAHESHKRGGTEPVVLTPAEAAERAEKLLTAQRDDLYGPPAPPAPVAPAASAPALFSRDTSAQPSKTTPATDDPKVLRAAALKAAGLDIRPWD